MAGSQPRGRKSPVLVPEFKDIVEIAATNKMSVALVKSWDQGIKADIAANGAKVTAGSKLLACRELIIGEDAAQEQVEEGLSTPLIAKVGIAWTKLEFVDQALKVVHPFDQ
eukprot:8425851-Karenia_brevis.AAC.1